MDAIHQPLLGLPLPSARALQARNIADNALVPSTSGRLALQASLQLCGKGACLRGFNVLDSRVGFYPKQHFLHLRGRSRHGIARCERASATVSESSNSDGNGSLVSSVDSTFEERFQAFLFYVTTFLVALPLFVSMVFVHPFVLVFDRHKRKAHHLINKIWATLTIFLFYKTEIEGSENLPGPDEPAVYVSNHQSFLDIYTLFLLGRPFKFISKTSIFLVPIIGWAMYLTGHVPLRRMDTKSQLECLKHCRSLLKQGVSVFFFPEGTRSRDGKMAHFKRGAFTLAAKANVPVVPVSLIGTGRLMPNGMEGTLRAGSVKLVIHPPLLGNDPDKLVDLSRTVISQSLTKHGQEVH